MLNRNKTVRYGLTARIFMGLVLGALTGILINALNLNSITFVRVALIDGLFHAGGQIFLRAIQLLVIPIVLISLVCGVAGLGDLKQLGRIGAKTVGLYLLTTSIAITMALTWAGLFSPGKNFHLEADTTFEAVEAPSLVDTLINIVPRNPISAMADGEMLQIICFALLLGLAITLSGKAGERVLSVFEALNEVIMKLVRMVISISPYGVFCLIAKVFSEQGFDAIAPLAEYFFTVLFVLLFHVLIVLPSLLKLFANLSPLVFAKKFNEVMFFAFSTASSNASIPVSLNAVQNKLGVNKSVASFTVPLGATVNMDGTAIMQGVATVFVANAYGIELGLAEYLTVILAATLASIGTAGVPGVGLIMLAMVFQQVGLPLEGIGVILGVDRLVDMVRTSINVCGDAVVSCIVAKSENQLDEEIFNKPVSTSDTSELHPFKR